MASIGLPQKISKGSEQKLIKVGDYSGIWSQYTHGTHVGASTVSVGLFVGDVPLTIGVAS